MRIRRSGRARLTTTMSILAVLLALFALPGGSSASGNRGADEEENEAIRVNPASSTGSCGVERWSVKTGTDADADLIGLQSTTQTTIASLDALAAPSSLPDNSRVKPTETTVFRLSATLTEYKLEDDSDYHLVLSDGSGHTMIAEIPDPACVGSTSPLRSSIQKARGEFDAKFTATGSFRTANVPVTVTGVGFFDFQHGQTGVAPNGIELHAVLDVQFGTSGGTGCSAAQLLGNPGFETGTAAPWTASSGVISNSSSQPAHSGSYDAWLDGYGTTHTDTLSQQVTVPTGCASATLSYWLHIDTAETTTSTAYDTLTVKANGTTVAHYSNLNAATGYHQYSVGLNAYIGQAVTLTVTGAEDYTEQTSFVLDDTALNVS